MGSEPAERILPFSNTSSSTTNRPVRRAALLAVVAGCLLVPAGAQLSRAEGRPAAAASNDGGLTRWDKTFLRRAAEDNQAAIELGQVVEQKGFSATTRNFARKLVAERSLAQQKLMAASRTLGLILPHRLRRRDRKAKRKLEKQSGAQLDRTFLRHMASDLERQYGSYEDTGMRTRSFAVKTYIESVLSDVKHQDQVAKAIAPGEETGSRAEP